MYAALQVYFGFLKQPTMTIDVLWKVEHSVIHAPKLFEHLNGYSAYSATGLLTVGLGPHECLQALDGTEGTLDCRAVPAFSGYQPNARLSPSRRGLRWIEETFCPNTHSLAFPGDASYGRVYLERLLRVDRAAGCAT